VLDDQHQLPHEVIGHETDDDGKLDSAVVVGEEEVSEQAKVNHTDDRETGDHGGHASDFAIVESHGWPQSYL
jgi:hypothetical protein